MAKLMNSNVLVLNKYFSGIAVCSLIRAISFAYDGRAEIIAITKEGFYPFNFDDWVDMTEQPDIAGIDPDKEILVKTAKLEFFAPRVVRLTASAYIPDGKKQLRPTRANILIRDDFTCQYCGKTPAKGELNIDHIIPKSKGGPSTWKNLVASFRRCNTYKGDKRLSDAGMRLLREPFKPKAVEFLLGKLNKKHVEEYRKVLGI